MEHRERLPQSPMSRVTLGVVAGLVLSISLLLWGGTGSYPDLHAMLDTSIALLSGVLALLFWDVTRRGGRAIARMIAISLTATFVLETVHALVSIEWSGVLAPIVQSAGVLRPGTWPPSAHLLPIGISLAVWLQHRGVRQVRWFAPLLIGLAAALVVIFYFLPAYTPPQFLYVTRPTLLLVPVLWGLTTWVCWKYQTEDRVLPMLEVMAAIEVGGHIAMLYSRAPHDSFAMVAHLGKVGGYLALLLMKMRAASIDTQERIRAEQRLAQLNETLEQRVTERTAELASTNIRLGAEVFERHQAELKVRKQVGRLELLSRITRASAERQDLPSIFQVVVRSLEDSLPIDFGCVLLYDDVTGTLIVSRVGVRSGALAMELAMPEQAVIAVDQNGLARCVDGQLVYEPDIQEVAFPFPQRLARGGLRSIVLSPLRVDGKAFGVLVCARREASAFSSGDCEFLLQLCEHVGLAARQTNLHAALQRAYNDLRGTREAVMQQERLRVLGQMASGIAHDINNAIVPISLYSEVLLEKETSLSPSARAGLLTIRRAIEDVARTVARMREFYRQRDSHSSLETEDLNTLVEQVVDLSRARWHDIPQQRGVVIELIKELAPALPSIQCAAGEVRDALINLVFNAVDAMPQGGTLTLRTGSLAAGEEDLSPPRSFVEVSDTGTGMDEATRQRCLEPFFTTKGERGTGLGLAMVYGMAQRHGADIAIQSQVGAGTTIRVIYPSATSGPSLSPASAEVVTKLPPMRLLVVDDDPVVLTTLTGILEFEEHTVVAASGGREGIETFELALEKGQPFAMVFTDLGMPYMDGREVAKAIKALSAETPVIMLTGWGARLESEREVPPHVDLILSKPPKLQELRNAMARLCVSAAPPVQRTPMRILLADDNEFNRLIAQTILTQRGYEVSIASNGRETIDLYRQQSFDLILMDVQMPEMDGLTAAAEIRALEQGQGKHVRIIAMTGHSLGETRRQLLRVGIDGYLAKPFKEEGLLAAVEGRSQSLSS